MTRTALGGSSSSRYMRAICSQRCSVLSATPFHNHRMQTDGPGCCPCLMFYGMGLKVYPTLSTRRAMSGIRDAVASGRMCKEPPFSTPIRYLEREDVTPVLGGWAVTTPTTAQDNGAASS